MWRKKRIDDPREEYITVDPEEDPITENSKRTLSLRTLKRILSMKVLWISTLLVLVGIFVFIFGKHKLSFVSRWSLKHLI